MTSVGCPEARLRFEVTFKFGPNLTRVLSASLKRSPKVEWGSLDGRVTSRSAVALALLLGKSLFDQIKLLPRGLAPCFIIGEHVVTAICRGAHKIHRLLAKLIATQRHIVAVAERLPICIDGTPSQGNAEADNRERAAHREGSFLGATARTLLPETRQFATCTESHQMDEKSLDKLGFKGRMLDLKETRNCSRPHRLQDCKFAAIEVPTPQPRLGLIEDTNSSNPVMGRASTQTREAPWGLGRRHHSRRPSLRLRSRATGPRRRQYPRPLTVNVGRFI